MPEKDFEQQARDKAADFSMEPKPEVWLRVEAAIAGPKRKRRFLIWWWLLPVAMAGSGLLFLYSKHQPETNNIKNNSQASVIIKNDPLTEENKKDKTNLESQKENKKNVLINQTNKRVYSSQSGYNSQKKILENSYQKQSNEPIKEQIKNKNYNSLHLQNKEILKEEVETFVINHKTDSNSVIIAEKSVDSSFLKPSIDTPFLHGDSLNESNKTTNIATVLKHAKQKGWHWGVSVAGGFASIGNDLFVASPAFDNLSAGSTGSWYSLNGNTSVSSEENKKGNFISVGLATQKNLSSHIYVAGEFAYRNQQSHSKQIIRISSSPTANNANADYSYSTFNTKQNFHFTSLSSAIGWQWIKGKKLSLSVEAGLDNSFLLSYKQTLGSSSLPDSLKSLTSKGYNRWQPFFTAALPIRFSLKKLSQLDVSPMISVGLKRFGKNDGVYKETHLSSAGIRLRYFFK